jgi:patatin-like phospholipase/acyl hydrolase
MGDCTMPIDLRRPYRVLSLDGGGVRGLMITTMLERIVKRQPDFMQNVRSESTKKFNNYAYFFHIVH